MAETLASAVLEVSRLDEEQVERELAFAMSATDTTDPYSLMWLAALAIARAEHMQQRAQEEDENEESEVR